MSWNWQESPYSIVNGTLEFHLGCFRWCRQTRWHGYYGEYAAIGRIGETLLNCYVGAGYWAPFRCGFALFYERGKNYNTCTKLELLHTNNIIQLYYYIIVFCSYYYNGADRWCTPSNKVIISNNAVFYTFLLHMAYHWPMREWSL